MNPSTTKSAAPAKPDGSRVVPFGKYKGRTLDDVASTPEGLRYLDWLVGQDFVRDDLAAAITTYLGDETVKRELAEALESR